MANGAEELSKVRKYLMFMLENKGSDLHIKAGSVFRARIQGSITKLGKEIFEPEEADAFAKEILGERYADFVASKELDMVYPFDENTRFRVNMFYQMNGISAVFRVIPIEIPHLKDLNLPEVIASFAKKERGLVLVTGVTGSGKSTTLAALVREINETTNKHIITIEDPIEFVHQDANCIVNQRSVGQDTLSFSAALKSALREDPDIILVGEMRDMETINLALHAADTGHLVLSTLHTIDVKETINRIIATFPTNEQNRVRLSLAGVIEGIISQRLVKTLDGGRRAAMEILIRTPMVEKLIMENEDYRIKDAIEAGKPIYKSQSFDQSLLDLYNEGVISKDEAKKNATSASDLELKMSGLTSMSDRGSESEEKQEMKPKDEDIFELK
ncbi:PilT/PilU family type 4a pilus ATPase [Sulfurimonas sp. SAG-AH-194-I05]|nr:PilT/PilU family type 4a pilus ATPase [Sulfurimonas sp. SAG-AH-194-I05]MDF1875805.1 PilT/PilU family type 4a pilus ATPase [Sulfurimonas sp. SAG-AH-194-I05]